MNLGERITLLVKLGKYLEEDDLDWKQVKQRSIENNRWFTEEFINLSITHIGSSFLSFEKLNGWIKHYHLDDNIESRTIGIVMAGNIPLVGFHDFLCAFITGHHQVIKLSEKDDILLRHLVEKLGEWNQEISSYIKFSERLNGCDAYIATGSNNSTRYFKYYFGKYPSLIRSNKTSVAILSGNETFRQLTALADDIYAYFGLGCRNVTKIYVPEGFDFVMLLQAFKKYNYLADVTKYKNNYDYNLALLIMNNKYYMASDSILLFESDNVFSPVSVLHYSFYKEERAVLEELADNENIQCIVGNQHIPFGKTQQPGLFDYADGIDTMQFLLSL